MVSLGLKQSLGGTESKVLEETNLSNLENRIRFSLKYSDIKKFCIRKLEDNEIEKLYQRFGYFEQMTWRQALQLPREKGFSAEKKDSLNYKMLKNVNSVLSSFFHFRVNGTNHPFRVFAGQDKELCYILLFDREGLKNHK